MAQTERDETIEIDLADLFGLLLNKIWIIIICTLVMGIIGFSVSKFMMTPKYDSTTGIYIMSNQDGNSISYSDTQLASQLTKDYEQLIVSRYVLETVIADCGINDSFESLKSRVSVKNATNTRIIYVTVTDTDPALAQYIANSIREVASVHIKNVTNVEAVNVVDMANLPQKPSGPSVKKYTLIAALIGLVISAAIIIVIYLVDDTIKTSDDVEKYLGLSTLALIPMMDNDSESGSKKKSKSSGGAKRAPVASAPVRTQAVEGGEE